MKTKNILWGLALIALGLVFGLNAMGLTNIDVFFDGWWSLFLIVPCTVGLFRERKKTGNFIGLLVGVVLLLCAQDILSYDMLGKLFFPALLVIGGVCILFRNSPSERAARRFIAEHKAETGDREFCSVFSGQKLTFAGEVFTGAKVTAIFGGIDLDLTGALLDRDVVIDATAIFGGVDVIVPPHYRVKICSNSIFGGVDEERPHATTEGLITVYVNGNCIFGGVSVK